MLHFVSYTNHIFTYLFMIVQAFVFTINTPVCHFFCTVVSLLSIVQYLSQLLLFMHSNFMSSMQFCRSFFCLMVLLFVCDKFASYTIELKPMDDGYKFLWPFVAVLIVCMCVMIMFSVSSYFVAIGCNHLSWLCRLWQREISAVSIE